MIAAKTHEKYNNLLYGGVAALVFIYLFIRAYTLPPLMDEITTYFQYIRTGSFQPYYAYMDANNHILNSLLGHIFYKTVGDSMFAIRLPALIGFIIYAFYGFKFYKSFKNPYAKYSFLTLLFCNQYFIEFFQISRGYGLSFAFLLGLLYHLKRNYETNKLTHFISGAVLNVLMIFANLSLLSWSLIFFILSLIIVLRLKKSRSGYLLILIITTGYFISFKYLLEYAFALKANGSLYLCSGFTFYEVIFIGLSRLLGSGSLPAGLLFIIPVLILWLVAIIVNIRKATWIEWGAVILFAGFNIGFILMYKLLKINYPSDRAGIQVYLLLITGYALALNKNTSAWLNYFSLIPIVCSFLLFVSGINFTHTVKWKNEAIPQSFTLPALYENKNREVPLTVSSHIMEISTWNYYNFMSENKLNMANENDFPDFSSDLVILSDLYSGEVPSYFDTIAMQESTKHVLLMNKNTTHDFSKTRLPDIKTQSEFIALKTIPLSGYNKDHLKLGLSFTPGPGGIPKDLWLVASTDSSGIYNHFEVGWLRPTEKTIKLALSTKITAEDNEVAFYLWNIDGKPVDLKNVEVFIEVCHNDN